MNIIIIIIILLTVNSSNYEIYMLTYMVYGIGIILRCEQKSGMWNVAVTVLSCNVQIIAGVESNCRLIGKHGQNSSTVGITYSVRKI